LLEGGASGKAEPVAVAGDLSFALWLWPKLSSPIQPNSN
jgi:hypothetical protein